MDAGGNLDRAHHSGRGCPVHHPVWAVPENVLSFDPGFTAGIPTTILEKTSANLFHFVQDRLVRPISAEHPVRLVMPCDGKISIRTGSAYNIDILEIEKPAFSRKFPH